MRPYIAFYKGNQHEINATSLYAAKLAAIKELKIPKKDHGIVAIMLADVPIDPASL
jgi:hypothetical protein